jgi:hypothetical protein
MSNLAALQAFRTMLGSLHETNYNSTGAHAWFDCSGSNAAMGDPETIKKGKK